MPDICRAISNPKRIELWREVAGEVPAGMRLGWSCSVPYCGKREHMLLVENLNANKRSWKELTQQVVALEVGSEIFLPNFPKDEIGDMRTALTMNLAKTMFIVRTVMSGGVRIVKTGSWDEYEEAKKLESMFPVVARRHNVNPNPFALQPGACFLGLMWNTAKPFSRPRVCGVKACPFPIEPQKEYCHRHLHFFDYSDSMTGKLDMNDLFAEDGQPHASFTSGWLWEEKLSYLHTNFQIRGAFDRGSKLSDQWWNQNVLREEAKVANSQGRGTRGGHPGNHKKVRKKQRQRPAGWHGSRPDHDVVKRWDREKIEEVPVWTPPAQTSKQRDEKAYHCDIKIPYIDDVAAEAQLAKLEEKGHWGLVAYECEYCGSWHLGHEKYAIDESDKEPDYKFLGCEELAQEEA